MPLDAFISNFIVGQQVDKRTKRDDININHGYSSCGADSSLVPQDLDWNDKKQKSESIGYLAQHKLFDQVPELLKDIITPDYCALLTPEDEEEEADEQQQKEENTARRTSSGSSGAPDEIILNAWLGPSTSVSPLHHDPYHNLLAQVVGFKYVRLYHPNESRCLHSLRGRMNNNRYKMVNLLSFFIFLFPLIYPHLFSSILEVSFFPSFLNCISSQSG